jgi:hypothetical protein
MRTLPLLLLLGLATPAHAQPAAEQESSEGPICADRGGLASATCVVGAGRVNVELGIDWSFQEDGDARTDTLLAGDTMVRIGVDERTEVQFGWTALGRVRDRSGTEVTSDGSVGDAFIGVRRVLHEGDGVAVSLQGRFGLPIGGSAIGAGDWGAELLVPLEFQLGKVGLLVTPSIAAAPDADRRGRHLAYGLAAGLGFDWSKRLSSQIDLSIARDEDPLGPSTEALAGFALTYLANDDLQLDAGAVIGLNRDSPDLELYLGAARRF